MKKIVVGAMLLIYVSILWGCGNKGENKVNQETVDNTEIEGNFAEDEDELMTENEEKKDKTTDGEYQLIWEDNFDGNKLNTADWNYELHEPGWVNNELQEYTASEDNTYVKDGILIIQALKNVDENGKVSYTSGRINTQNKHDFKYGKFEVRAKVPSGQGFLPAFWMMPTNENLYGQWPKCGEIDIMEVLGHETDKAYATLHFGEPHTQKQGSYVTSGKDFASEFHTYTCEWNPGEMNFYIDGVLFHTVNDWFTMKPGFEEIAYPAPYDQPFYMILNLAVGGNWPGNPDDSTTFDENAQLQVDYVRVYRKDEYDENVTKPVKDLVFREPDTTGNYIINGDFSETEKLDDQENWGFLLSGTGKATATMKDNALHIVSEDSGDLDYSVQVVQPDLPMEQGQRYKVSFDAFAKEKRTIKIGVTAPDNGYIRYLQDTLVNLTTDKKTYEFEFDMTENDDINGRLEFNFGNQGSTATVVISNVRVEKLGKIDLANEKTMLPDGNYVFNGTFDQGTGRMAYWTVNKQDESAQVSVTNVDNVRELMVSVPNVVNNLEDVIIEQKDIAISGQKDYVLSFTAYADANKNVKVRVAEQTFDVDLTTNKENYKFAFTTGEGASKAVLQFLLGTQGTMYIDEVRIQEDGMLVNGDFSNGFAGYEVYTNDEAALTYGVDSLKENGAASFDISNTGSMDWMIQLKQSNITLEEGKWYKITFDAKSSTDRAIMYALQRDGSADNDWTPYSGSNIIQLTNDYQTFESIFQMTSETDSKTILSISMGAVSGTQMKEKHTVCIDNIQLEETSTLEN